MASAYGDRRRSIEFPAASYVPQISMSAESRIITVKRVNGVHHLRESRLFEWIVPGALEHHNLHRYLLDAVEERFAARPIASGRGRPPTATQKTSSNDRSRSAFGH
jgi:hypothetical protein